MTRQVMQPEVGHQHAAEQLSVSISMAWTQVSTCGAAGRYIGRGADGRHEFQLNDPVSGARLASGHGRTVAEAMTAATQEMRISLQTINPDKN